MVTIILINLEVFHVGRVLQHCVVDLRLPDQYHWFVKTVIYFLYFHICVCVEANSPRQLLQVLYCCLHPLDGEESGQVGGESGQHQHLDQHQHLTWVNININRDVSKVCSICVQDVCKVCARCVQDVRKMCARCVQGVRKMCARCAQYVCKMYAYVMFDIIEPHAFRKYSTCWVLEKSEEPCRILEKFVYACVVNLIHAKVLPGSVLYIEH